MTKYDTGEESIKKLNVNFEGFFPSFTNTALLGTWSQNKELKTKLVYSINVYVATVKIQWFKILANM